MGVEPTGCGFPGRRQDALRAVEARIKERAGDRWTTWDWRLTARVEAGQTASVD